MVRRAIDEMKARGATPVDIVIPDLAKLVTASNLLSQELKVYLGDYLKGAGAYATSIEEMLESGLHTSGIQGILDVANATPNDYLSSEDYKGRLAARETLAKAVLDVMEASRLDAIAYPTIRRIAPVVGGAQPGSNAALSANTGLPAITVPAGFTPGGFPVGLEFIGRRFAEPTLLALAFDFERSTHHRRPPAMTPALVSARSRRREHRGDDCRCALDSRVAGSVPGGCAFHVRRVDAAARLRHSSDGNTRGRGRCLPASAHESAERRRRVCPREVGDAV